MNLNPNKEIAEFIYNNKDDSVFILKDKNHYENIILYTYGHKAKNNLKIIKSKDLDKAGFEDLINKNKNIYTDSFGGVEAISTSSATATKSSTTDSTWSRTRGLAYAWARSLA